jgi:hypothetical protein
MGGKRPFLLSGAMLSLYGACVGAVVLNAMRGRWGSAAWFPVAVGGVATMAIVPLTGMLEKGVESGARAQAVFFFVLGTLLLAVLPFLGRKDVLLICGVVVMSGIFLYAGLATCLEWPGFGPPADPDACPVCGCEDIGDDGICRGCGELVGPVYCPRCGCVIADDEGGVCQKCGVERDGV